MKKIISIVLAVTLFVWTVGIVTANANSLDESNISANSTVTFRQPSTYCLYIPDVIDLDTEFCISGDVNISYNESLYVNITNLDSNNALTFTSQDGSATLKRAINAHPNIDDDMTMQDLGLSANCVGYFLKGDTSSEVNFGLADGYTDFSSMNGDSVPPAGSYYSQAEFEVFVASH